MRLLAWCYFVAGLTFGILWVKLLPASMAAKAHGSAGAIKPHSRGVFDLL